MTMDGKNYVRIPAEDQPGDRLYEMCIRFRGDVVFNPDHGIFRLVRDDARLAVEKAVTLRISQVLPAVPDDGMLGKYAEILEDAQKDSDEPTRIENIRFDGYDWIYAVKPIVNEQENRNDQ